MTTNSNSNTNNSIITLSLDILGDAIEVVEKAYDGEAAEAAARDLGVAAVQAAAVIARGANTLNENLLNAVEESGIVEKAAELVRQTKELKAPWERFTKRVQASNARLESRLDRLAGIYQDAVRAQVAVYPDIGEKESALQKRAQRLALKIQGIDPDAFEREFAGFESAAV